MVNLGKIIAAVLVLAGLALGIYAWTLSRQPVLSGPPPVAAKPSYAVVVANKPLPAGQAIKAEDLRIEQLPMQPTDAFHDPQLVAGRVPIMDMGAGSPIVDQQLASGLSIKIAEGERAVAVKVDESVGVGTRYALVISLMCFSCSSAMATRSTAARRDCCCRASAFWLMVQVRWTVCRKTLARHPAAVRERPSWRCL